MLKFQFTHSVLWEHTCWFSLSHQFATQVSLQSQSQVKPRSTFDKEHHF